MRIAPNSLMLGFSNPNTFTLYSMAPSPVILCGAEAKSQNTSFQKVPFLRVYGGIVLKNLYPSKREVRVRF